MPTQLAPAYLDKLARSVRLEVERVEGGRVWFKFNPEHGPNPIDWPLDQVLDGSRFIPTPT